MKDGKRGTSREHRARFNSLCSPEDFPLKNTTEKMISCAIEVRSSLGPGLLERVYEEVLAYEFEPRGINYEKQKSPKFAILKVFSVLSVVSF